MSLINKVLFLASFILVLPISSCGTCDAIDLADLIVGEVEQRSEAEVFTIIHKVLNSIAGVACPDGVEMADSHNDEVPIEFSDNNDFTSNSTQVAMRTLRAEPIEADESYEITSEIVFEVDGFYRIIANLDVDNEVEERNENNNTQIDAITGGRVRTASKNYTIIEVRNTGNKDPKIDRDGNPIFIKNWNIKIN